MDDDPRLPVTTVGLLPDEIVIIELLVDVAVQIPPEQVNPSPGATPEHATGARGDGVAGHFAVHLAGKYWGQEHADVPVNEQTESAKFLEGKAALDGALQKSMSASLVKVSEVSGELMDGKSP